MYNFVWFFFSTLLPRTICHWVEESFSTPLPVLFIDNINKDATNSLKAILGAINTRVLTRSVLSGEGVLLLNDKVALRASYKTTAKLTFPFLFGFHTVNKNQYYPLPNVCAFMQEQSFLFFHYLGTHSMSLTSQ